MKLALNPNSRMLPLMRALNNTYHDAEDACVNAIRTVLVWTAGSGVCMLCVSLILSLWMLIPFAIFIGLGALLIFYVIPYQFNMKEIQDSIYGDTFKTMEVNVELVMLWMSKCNMCIGRARFLTYIYPYWSAFVTFLFGFAILVLR